jgi:hypothetical protein
LSAVNNLLSIDDNEVPVSINEDIVRDFELLKQELKTKTEEKNMGAPELVYIEHDDYHAKYVGRTDSGVQFFFPPIFVPGGDEFEVLFLFNDAGDLIESKIENFGPRSTYDAEKADALRVEWMAQLEPFHFQDIQVKPFFVEHSGELIGLIPCKYDDYWTVEVLPGNVMCFTEPWDSGIYDT